MKKLTIQIPEQHYEVLRELAFHDRTSQNALIRRAIELVYIVESNPIQKASRKKHQVDNMNVFIGQ